jgi:hypothetical protein
MKANRNNTLTQINRSLPALMAVILSASLSTAFAETEDNNDKSDDSNNGNWNGGTYSSVQSKADPLGLAIVNKVKLGGSSEASLKFDQDVLPSALKFVQSALPEGQNNSKKPTVVNIDPSKLTLAAKTDVQAIFISEGAGYHNTLGFNTTGTGVKEGNPKIIFPDASSTVGYGATGVAGKRTPSEPLLPGDYVNLGTYAKGTKLDFFLIADGASGGKTVYNSNGQNPDGINHVGMFTPSIFALPELNSPYIFVSFEDLYGGGDKDYNDVVFAFNVGKETVHTLLATPEPSMYLTLGGFLALGLWAKRRMDRTESAKA